MLAESIVHDSDRLRILIVDDHEVVREGLVSALGSDSRNEVVGAVGTGRAAIQQAKRTLPDIALVDLRLPDTSGEELCRKLRDKFPGTAVVMLSTYLSEGTVQSAIDAGATGYVTKSAGLTELRAALDSVREAERSPEATSGLQIADHLHKLVSNRIDEALPTPRQEQVLELAAQGLTNKEIGKRLYVSESTVRFHVQKLKEKLGARTKTELIAKAIRSGLIAPASEDDSTERS